MTEMNERINALRQKIGQLYRLGHGCLPERFSFETEELVAFLDEAERLRAENAALQRLRDADACVDHALRIERLTAANLEFENEIQSVRDTMTQQRHRISDLEAELLQWRRAEDADGTRLHFSATCDGGHCEEPTTMLVRDGDRWIGVCSPQHAMRLVEGRSDV